MHLLKSCAIFVSLVTLLPSGELAAQNWGQTHSERDLQTFIESKFAGRRIPTSQVLMAARNAGWLATTANAKLFKSQLRSVAKRIGPSTRCLVVPDPNRPQSLDAGGPIYPAAKKETEYNNSEGYANDIGLLFSIPTIVTGTLPTTADADTIRFSMVIEGRVTIKVTGTGGIPEMQLSNANGDAVWGYHWWDTGTITLDLPVGTYHLTLSAINATAAVTYSTSFSLKSQTIPTLAFSKTSTGALSASQYTAYRIVLPADGRLNVTTKSTNASDTMLILHNDQWGFIYDPYDAGVISGSKDTGLDALLPKGTYYAYILGDQVDTMSITATFTAATIPTLGSTPINGNLKYLTASYDIYKFVLTKTEQVTLKLQPYGGTTATTDTYMQILDRKMQSMFESWENSTSWFSTITLTLPAGTYYVSSGASWSNGGYTASLSRGTAVTVTAQAGINPVSLATDTAATLALSLLTPSRIEVNIVEIATFDGQMSIIDARTGLTFAWEDDEYMGGQSCTLGMVLPAGDYFVNVKGYKGTPGSCDVQIMLPFHRWAGDIVGYQGHGGSLLYFVVGVKQVAGYNPLAGIMSGSLLIPLGPPTVILPSPLGGSGKINFGVALKPGRGVFIQAAEVDTTLGKGFYTNLLK
jgi:hypothetical protein